MNAESITRSGEIWTPDPERIAQSQVMALASTLGSESFDDLYERSLRQPQEYWADALRFLDVRWSQPYKQYVDLSRGAPFPHWFVGGSLNWVETALRWAEHPMTASRLAIIAEREDGSQTALTYGDLLTRVQRFANGLLQLGLHRGDRVGFLMPSGTEAIIALLSLSYIGAVAVPLFSGFGTDAIVARLSGCTARALLTVNGFRRRGRWIDLTALIAETRQRLSCLEFVVVNNYEDQAGMMPGCVDWEAVAAHPRAPLQPASQMDPDDPFMIIFTSGTTGAPKGAVHTHGGFPLKITHDAAVHFDLDQKDVWLWPADMGWVVGPITAIGALTRGATLVCYDGAPDFPDYSRLAKIIERFRVTHFGASPTLVRSLAAAGSAVSLPQTVDMTSIKLLITAGEVIDQEHFLWFFNGFGRGACPVINYTGGTEVSGALLANVVVRPIVPAAFNTGSPSIEIDVVDDNGHSVVDGVGELVIRKPFVGMTKGFWKDEHRYVETYWSRFPDTWVHGDLAMRKAEHGESGSSFLILGRSDDTLKIAGKRLGPAEVEEVALEISSISEAAAIGVDDPQKGQRLVLFLVVSNSLAGHSSTGETQLTPDIVIEEEVAKRIERKLGKPFRPAQIHVVSELPKTRNAKVMRRVIKRIYRGEPTGDLSALENPSAIAAICSKFGAKPIPQD